MADWFKKRPMVFDLGKDVCSTPEKDSVIAKICACDNCRKTAMCRSVFLRIGVSVGLSQFWCVPCIESSKPKVVEQRPDFDLLGGPCL